MATKYILAVVVPWYFEGFKIGLTHRGYRVKVMSPICSDRLGTLRNFLCFHWDLIIVEPMDFAEEELPFLQELLKDQTVLVYTTLPFLRRVKLGWEIVGDPRDLIETVEEVLKQK